MKQSTEDLLSSALNFFNNQNKRNITFKNLSSHLGIDEVDILEHYSSLEEIYEALYLEFMEKLVKAYSLDRLAVGGPYTFVEIIHQVMQLRYDYRYISSDFEVIMNENTRLRKHYISNRIAAKQVFQGIFNVWRNMGYMAEEENFGAFDDLFARLEMMLEHWPVAGSIYVKKGGKDRIITYHRIIVGELYPFLTLRGKEELNLALQKFSYS